MSRRAYESSRMYGDLIEDDNKAASTSSSRRSRWDDRSDSRPHRRREEEHADRYDSRNKSVGNDDKESFRSKADYKTDKSGSRNDREAQNYKDRRERERRRSQSPSSSVQFSHDRERERKAYDHKYGTTIDKSPSKDNSQPDFGSSGLLAKESNQKNGVQLKYHEPPEARKPKKKWRLYVFKDGKEIEILHISRQSCYLIGRDLNVVDIHVEHQSISKQHCVIQFRTLTERNEFGDEKRQIKPYLIDLDSSNGSFVNKTEIPPSRYYELRNGDTIKLGASQREYVLLAED